jgi:hypothetical protein
MMVSQRSVVLNSLLLLCLWLPAFGDPCVCDNTCLTAHSGSCDDGGPGSDFGMCSSGTDCADCGPSIRKKVAPGTQCVVVKVQASPAAQAAQKQMAAIAKLSAELPCPLGKYHGKAVTGGDKMTSLAEGVIPNMAPCVSCPPGKFGGDGRGCKACTAANTFSVAGEAKCKNCPAGKHQIAGTRVNSRALANIRSD